MNEHRSQGSKGSSEVSRSVFSANPEVDKQRIFGLKTQIDQLRAQEERMRRDGLSDGARQKQEAISILKTQLASLQRGQGPTGSA